MGSPATPNIQTSGESMAETLNIANRLLNEAASLALEKSSVAHRKAAALAIVAHERLYQVQVLAEMASQKIRFAQGPSSSD